MSKYLKTIKQAYKLLKQFLSFDKYTLGLIKKYSNLEFQWVFLRSLELESGGSGQVYSWYPAPGSLLAFPHLWLLQLLEGPHIHVGYKICGTLPQAIPLPLLTSCFLATLEVCIPFWLALGMGALGGGIGGHWKGLKVIQAGDFKVFQSQSMVRVENGYRFLLGMSPCLKRRDAARGVPEQDPSLLSTYPLKLGPLIPESEAFTLLLILLI